MIFTSSFLNGMITFRLNKTGQRMNIVADCARTKLLHRHYSMNRTMFAFVCAS